MTPILLLLAFPSHAAEAQFGGAINLVAGITAGESGAVGALGLQQAEGDVRVGARDLAFTMQLDLAATFSGDGIFLYSISPERLVAEGGGPQWKLQGGIFPAYFRMESVDPWRNSAVVRSLASARVPGTVFGAGAELGGDKGGVDLLLGVQPSTVDVFRIDDGPVWLPFIAGARGRVAIESVRIAGGAWFGGNLGALGFGGLELGVDANLGVVVPYGEFVSDLQAGHAGFLGADLFPDGVVSPGARIELDSQRGFGVGVSAASTLFECPGFFKIGAVTFDCWNHAGHGRIALRKALEQSCNVYFLQMGLACGYEHIQRMAEAAGFGERTGIGLLGESAGLLPSDEWKRSARGDAWRLGDTCNASIGQDHLYPQQVVRVQAYGETIGAEPSQTAGTSTVPALCSATARKAKWCSAWAGRRKASRRCGGGSTT